VKRSVGVVRSREQRAQRKIIVAKCLPPRHDNHFLRLGQAFAATSRQFTCKVSLTPEPGKGDYLCPYKFVRGSPITVRARGVDAKAAVATLSSLLEAGFDARVQHAKARVIIKNKYGMHTRPSLAFMSLAVCFRSAVILEANGVKVDGASLMALGMLNLRRGDSAIIHAIGIDAQAATRALAKLIRDGFGDAERQVERSVRAQRPSGSRRDRPFLAKETR
jgi:phosphocarrier protein HPr